MLGKHVNSLYSSYIVINTVLNSLGQVELLGTCHSNVWSRGKVHLVQLRIRDMTAVDH